MRHFITRMLAATMALCTMLALDSLLQGNLPLLGALALLPAFVILTVRLFALSVRRPARRRTRQPAERRAAARQGAPALRVAPGGHYPGGPRAA